VIFSCLSGFCSATWNYFYTLAESIMISVRILLRSEGDVSNTKTIYILDQYQTSHSVLKLSEQNLPKSLVSIASSVLPGKSRIGQL